MEQKTVVFNGETYIRNPKSRYYFKHTTRNCERKHAVQLHRAVWEYYNGKIPEGYHIHHIDGDIDNNDISNLECVFSKQHLSEHSKKNWENQEYREKASKNLEEQREKTKQWHASAEGREWHRKHAAQSICKVFENKQIKQCEFCGKEFPALHFQRFCCQSCAEKARYRNHHSLLADERRTCDFCGKEYTPVKSKQRFCCKKCKNKWSVQHRKACV